MSKKDYVAIAKVVNTISKDQSAAMYKSILVSRLADLFSGDNERFNSAEFRAACYVSEKEASHE